MIVAGLLYIGFFALAAAMTRHGPALLGPWQRHGLTRHLSLLGWSAIALSLLGAILAGADGIGVVTWCGLLPMMAGAVLLALTYGPRLARGGLLVALALMVAGAV